jgi:hypothetical protein
MAGPTTQPGIMLQIFVTVIALGIGASVVFILITKLFRVRR